MTTAVENMIIAVYERLLRMGHRQPTLTPLERELLDACEGYHKAIDTLFGQLIFADKDFMPSESGQPWTAMQEGLRVMTKVKGLFVMSDEEGRDTP